MDPFSIAWGLWLKFSILGVIVSISTWKQAPIISGAYIIGSLFFVFTRFSNPDAFGISDAELWKQVRVYLIGGQFGLIAFTVIIEKLLTEHWEKTAQNSNALTSANDSCTNDSVANTKTYNNVTVNITHSTKTSGHTSSIDCSLKKDVVLLNSFDAINSQLHDLGYSVENNDSKYIILSHDGTSKVYAYSNDDLKKIVSNIAAQHSINIIWNDTDPVS